MVLDRFRGRIFKFFAMKPGSFSVITGTDEIRIDPESQPYISSDQSKTHDTGPGILNPPVLAFNLALLFMITAVF